MAIFYHSETNAHCIRSDSVMFDTKIDYIHANPSNSSKYSGENFPWSDPTQYWFKSSSKAEELKEKKLIISPVNLNFCSSDINDQTESAKSLAKIKVGTHTGRIELENIILNKWDQISFFPSLKEGVKINQELCKTKNDIVYINNKDDCLNYLIGSEHVVNFSLNHNIIAPNQFQWLEGKFYSDILHDGEKYNTIMSGISLKCEILKNPQMLENNQYIDNLTENEMKWAESLDYDENKMLNSAYQLYNLESQELNRLCKNICRIYSEPFFEENMSLNHTTEQLLNIPQKLVTEYSNQCALSISTIPVTNTAGIAESVSYFQGLHVELQDFNNPSNTVQLPIVDIPDDAPNILAGIRKDHLYENSYFEKAKVILYLSQNARYGRHGEYEIIAKKDCPHSRQDALYYYIGNEPPTFKPGESSSILVPDIHQMTLPENSNGNIYFGVKDNGDGYGNNVGHFEISYSVPKKIKPLISNALGGITRSIHNILYGNSVDTTFGAVVNVYKGLFESSFIQLIHAILVLYIAIYSLFYMIGLIKTPYFQAFTMLLKISLVLVMTSPDSWDFFYKYLFSIFINGTESLMGIFTQSMQSYDNQGIQNYSQNFIFIDSLLFRFIQSETWIQIFAIAISGPIGFIFAGAIIWGSLTLFAAVFIGVITYFISIVMIALLLCISPIFILCILFKKTKAIFDSWIKTLMHTAIQPVALFIVIALLEQIMNGATHALFNYDVCQTCILEVKKSIGNDQDLSFCLFQWYRPITFSTEISFDGSVRNMYSSGGFMGLPISIASLLTFIILANIIQHAVAQSGTIITSIFGAMGTELNSGGDSPSQSAQETLLGFVGQDQGTSAQRSNDNLRAQREKGNRNSLPKFSEKDVIKSEQKNKPKDVRK